MARADAADVLAWPSANGSGVSIARRSWRDRLDSVETWLRIAVPVLLVTFLGVVATVTILEIQISEEATLASEADTLAILGVALTERLRQARPASDGADVDPRAAAFARLSDGARDLRLPETVQIYLAAQDGRILAARGTRPADPRRLTELLGDDQPLTTLADRAGIIRLTLPSGQEVLAGLRQAGAGQLVAIVLPLEAALGLWSARTRAYTILLASGALCLVGAAGGFLWQSSRAHASDSDCRRIRLRMDTALARGRCGLWDWDIARGRIAWSRSMFEMLGMDKSPEPMSFGDLNALVHPEDADLYALAAEVAEGRAQTVDRAFRMRHANGDWVWLRARAEVVRDAPGAEPHLVGIAVDITEQRRLVDARRTSDERLRDAVEAISEAFVLWDENDRLVLCNSKFQSAFELPDDLVQPGVRQNDVCERAPLVRLMAVTAESEGRSGVETRLPNGRWLQISERRTKDGGCVSIGTDITPVKTHEEQLLDSERKLIALVADLRRSRQAIERQAQQLADLAGRYLEQKAEAECAYRAKAEFLANMSHELRTPLNAIIGFAEMMEGRLFGELGSEKYGEYVRDIRSSGQYLLNVIGDILDMSSLEAGRIRIARRPLLIDDVVGEAVVSVARMAEDKGLSFSASAPGDAVVEVDRGAILRVLVHLLSNAIKYTPAGGRIAIRARRGVSGFNIFVEDSGIGIPTETLAKLGRPFERASNAATADAGSGLGLAIANSLVSLHGGRIRIRSAEGVGTVVLVHLPDAPAAEAGSPVLIH